MSPSVTIFVGNFFFSISTSLSVYVLLPFLALAMPAAATGLAIAAGGLISLILFPILPALEERVGAQLLVLILAVLELLALIALAAAPGPLLGAAFVVIAYALQPCISYGLDLLFEAAGVGRASAGRTRTIFLTAWNVGVLATPLMLSTLLMNTNAYARVFVAAAAMLVPFIVILTTKKLPAPREMGHKSSYMKDTLVCIARDPDLSAVTFAHFLLYLFYMWAPFYTPIYLHTVLGFAWSTLGWLFAIMILPYVLIEYPAGWLADHYLGDKELMFAGFILAGTALAFLSILTPTSSLFLIGAILFVSRIGTALIESMSEGHFFRRVTAQDINSISFFRGVWPIAYTVGPLVASAILFFADFHLFFILTGGFITLAGIATTLSIRDFR